MTDDVVVPNGRKMREGERKLAAMAGGTGDRKRERGGAGIIMQLTICCRGKCEKDSETREGVLCSKMTALDVN